MISQITVGRIADGQQIVLGYNFIGYSNLALRFRHSASNSIMQIKDF